MRAALGRNSGVPARLLTSVAVSSAPVATGDRSAEDVEDEEAEIGVHSRADGYMPVAIDAVRSAPSLHGDPTFILSCRTVTSTHVRQAAMTMRTVSCSPSSS